MRSKGIVAVAILGVFAICSQAHASEEKEAAALRAAESWLVLVDAGNYSESWDAAAGYLQNAVGRDQLKQALDAARRPLGKALSRQLKSKSFMTALPGAPDGQYVVIQFETSFEHKRSGIETVTPMMDRDGRWRVSGYYIN